MAAVSWPAKYGSMFAANVSSDSPRLKLRSPGPTSPPLDGKPAMFQSSGSRDVLREAAAQDERNRRIERRTGSIRRHARLAIHRRHVAGCRRGRRSRCVAVPDAASSCWMRASSASTRAPYSSFNACNSARSSARHRRRPPKPRASATASMLPRAITSTWIFSSKLTNTRRGWRAWNYLLVRRRKEVRGNGTP